MRTGSATRMVRNEYAKMRHLRIELITALLLLGVCALTVLSALSSGLVNHRFDADGDGWRLLMVSLHGAVGLTSPLLLAVMASRQVEVEHSGQGWMSSATAVGSLVLGLPGVLPSRYLVAGLLIAVACAPVCAVQSGLAAFTRSFAVPVAIGLALTGAGTTALLVHIPAAWLLPHALVTRTTQIGATSDGAALVFAAQDLTWTSAAVTVGISAALSAVVVLATSVTLERSDTRGG